MLTLLPVGLHEYKCIICDAEIEISIFPKLARNQLEYATNMFDKKLCKKCFEAIYVNKE